MKRLRVACLASHPSPYQRDLFAALARRPEVDLHVFYQEFTAPDHSPWQVTKPRPFEHRLPGMAFGNWLVRAQLNWRLPRADAFDVWMVNTLHYSPGAQAAMRWHLRHVPWIYWGEGLRALPGWWRPAVQRLAATALAGADGIAAVGTAAVADYRRRFPGKRVEDVPYVVDLRRFADAGAQRVEAPDGRTTILFCGQLIERKGIDLLLEAFATLVGEGHNLRLLLVGRGTDLPKRLAAYPREVRERVEATDFVQPPQLPRYFKQSDIFVLPSRQDGWGVVVNQAVGAGLPLVVSDVIGAVDLVRPGWNGAIVPTGDAAALADALRVLITDPARRREMGANSAALAREISPEVGALKWVRLLRETVDRA